MEIVKANNYRKGVIGLLVSEKLPVVDLPAMLDNFVVMKDGKDVIGVAGLEIYGDYGLLRSLAVHPIYRGNGLAKQLLTKIESMAAAKALSAIYLLTETAPEYFSRNGYHQTNRTDVPALVQQSSEFSYACPKSAIVMKKTLIKS
jgi:amino-acid N-acetyltransferase